MTKTKQIRLTPPLFHILLSLTEGEKHGYGIMLEVRQRTGGNVKLGPGSLYWSLDRLEECGLIAEAGDQKTGSGEERRVYYRLTGKGRNTLRDETAKLADIVELARAREVI